MDRPSFTLEIQAKIEQARDEVFKNAESRFDMLFFSSVPAFFIQSVLATVKNIPVQRKPATLKMQLAQYAAALYDAEAVHYSNLTQSNSEMAIWLGNLAERINKEVRKVAEDDRNDVHCGLQDRLNAVTDALAARAQSFLDAKQKANSKPIHSHAPRPIIPVIPLPALPVELGRWPEPHEIQVEPTKESPQIESGEVARGDAKSIEIERRTVLLREYKKACGDPSEFKIYNARNSGIHKPQFYAWKKADLPSSSQTCINFERFLKAKKPPIPRKPKEF